MGSQAQGTSSAKPTSSRSKTMGCLVNMDHSIVMDRMQLVDIVTDLEESMDTITSLGNIMDNGTDKDMDKYMDKYMDMDIRMAMDTDTVPREGIVSPLQPGKTSPV